MRRRAGARVVPMEDRLDLPAFIGGDEHPDDLRIKLRSGMFSELLKGNLRMNSFPVGPVGGYRIKGVADRNDSGHRRDGPSFQCVRISLSVILFMMVEDAGNDRPERPYIFNDLRPDHGVTLHHLGLLRLQAVRLSQNTIFDSNLADIMKRGGELELIQLLF